MSSVIHTPIPTDQQLDELYNKAYEIEISDDLSDFEDDDPNAKPLLEQARERYEFLVDHGHMGAKTRLAVFLHYGWGGEQDKERCLEFLKQTAAAGDEMAVRYLETHKKSGGRSLGIPQC
jgi:TPR repeat protein